MILSQNEFFWQWKKDQEQAFADGDMKLGGLSKQSKEIYSSRVQIYSTVSDDAVYWRLIVVSLN